MSTNSSLQPWIDFDNYLLYSPLDNITFTNDILAEPVIQPCTVNGTQLNCTDICSDVDHLFDLQSTQNLLTCGSWVDLQVRIAEINATTGGIGLDPAAIFAPFLQLGLDQTNETYLSSIRSDITSCFQFIYENNKYSTSQEGYEIAACDLRLPTTFNVDVCVHSLCAPPTMNEDLGGMEVFISFLLQSSISISAFVLLTALEPKLFRLSPSKGRYRSNKHTEILLAALVEFQKAQCYFATTVQIASLVYTVRFTPFTLTGPNQYDYLDEKSLPNIGTTGYVPVVFSLVCIARYGQASWYIIILSLCSVGISTATLKYLVSSLAGPSQIQYIDLTQYRSPCGENLETVSWLLRSWCGPNSSDPVSRILNKYVGPNRFEWDNWHWLLWTNCVVWILYCVIQQARKHNEGPRFLRMVFRCLPKESSSSTRLDSSANKDDQNQRASSRSGWEGSNIRGRPLLNSKIARWAGSFLFVTIWAITFGFQFDFYSYYWSSHQISNQWSFGQVIAVAIWAPSIVEYIYLLINGIEAGSQYRLTPPLAVVAQPQFTAPEISQEDTGQ